MAGINFSIKKADKKGLCPIYLTFQQKGQKFRYYTKLKTTASGWNGSRVKVNYTGYAEINSILDDLENNLKEIEREAIFNKKEYTLETFKRKFFSRLGGLNSRNDFFQPTTSLLRIQKQPNQKPPSGPIPVRGESWKSSQKPRITRSALKR